MVPRASDSRLTDSGSDGFSSQSGVNCMQVIYLQILTSQSCACPSAQVCHFMISNRCVSVIRLTATVVDDPQTICLDDCPKSPWLRVITPCPKQLWTAESAGAEVRALTAFPVGRRLRPKSIRKFRFRGFSQLYIQLLQSFCNHCGSDPDCSFGGPKTASKKHRTVPLSVHQKSPKWRSL